MKRHSHLPICSTWTGPWVSYRSLKPLGGFSLLKVSWNCFDLQLCKIMVISPFDLCERAHGYQFEPYGLSYAYLWKFSLDLLRSKWYGMTKFCNVKSWHILAFHGPERISLKFLDLFSPFEVVNVQRHFVSPQMVLVKCCVLVTNNGPMLNFLSFLPISLDTLFNIMNISCLIISELCANLAPHRLWNTFMKNKKYPCRKTNYLCTNQRVYVSY